MIHPKHIRIEDYNYPLPEERIAKYPLPQRDQSKLLIYKSGRIEEQRFTALPHFIDKGELLVFNNTRVIQARMFFRKETGALIEIFCLEPFAPHDYSLNFAQTTSVEWLCLIGNAKKWKEGILSATITKGEEIFTLRIERVGQTETAHKIKFMWDNEQITFGEILQIFGELPIPPYLNRDTEEKDKQTYQTVYSKIEGSVAAPTAGLHFTEDTLQALRDKGVDIGEVTLHVGAGTFKPVKSEEIGEHEMHIEYISVSKSFIDKLIAHGGKATAVGTTSVRTLESLYHIGAYLHTHTDTQEEELCVPQWIAYEEKHKLSTIDALQAIMSYLEQHKLHTLHLGTQIIIAPGYKFHIVQKIITNFHQPQSTLLLLVSAFLNGDWKRIYDYALQHDFRFLSYGDSSLLIP